VSEFNRVFWTRVGPYPTPAQRSYSGLRGPRLHLMQPFVPYISRQQQPPYLKFFSFLEGGENRIQRAKK
jgi:hypothetical protein